jgi:hypothetical protein
MESTLTDDAAASRAGGAAAPWESLLEEGTDPVVGHPSTDDALSSAFRAEIDDPELVLSPAYIGHDRRATGLRAWLARATFKQRRSLLSLEFLVVAVVVALAAATILLVGGGHATASEGPARTLNSSSHAPATTPAPAPVATTVPTPTTTVPAPTTTAPAPTATVPAAAPVAAASPAPAPTPTTAPAPAPTALTPTQMGADALALVRYPWQSIPGYSIQFLPIADAPSPGFYGNTTFTWGQAGGTSVLYVYPGETVDTLAGITAFEIGHEVDAAAVEPQGGEAQIENILNIHPASWAPNCDCAEQGFLSGWYAAAFSNYWSPGVGQWSQVAPEPSGAILAAVEPWLNPTIS